MPLKLYEKEQILDACFTVFAEKGYTKTSTAMLSEAAGISKALLFHHFKSKKMIYINVLERCFDRMAAEYQEEPLSDMVDFFQAKAQSGLNKIKYLRRNPDIAKILYEAYIRTPEDIKEEMGQFVSRIKIKYGSVEQEKNKMLIELFGKIPLRDSVKYDAAFEFIGIVDDYFRKKIAIDLTDESKLQDDVYWDDLIAKKRSFLDMVCYGIQEKGR